MSFQFFCKLLKLNLSKKSYVKSRHRQLELLGLEERVVPATITVTNTSDTGANSFRQAIIDANASPANDIIDFNFATGSSPYTITLQSALQNIANASTAGTLTITGPSASSLTINGSNGSLGGFSIFTIDTGGDLTISGVTVTGANTSSNGGGFNNNGILSISNSLISSNTSSSQANGGGAGGIFNNTGATLTVSNSTISNNKGLAGAGIHNFGGTVTAVSYTHLTLPTILRV